MKLGDKLYKYINETIPENETEQQALARQSRDSLGHQNYRFSYADMAAWCNQNNAVITDKGTYVVISSPPTPTQQEQLQSELAQLKSYLSSTDWIVVKCMELGVSVSETYPSEYSVRTYSRKRINEIEQKLNS